MKTNLKQKEEVGLTFKEVQERLQRFGPNSIPEVVVRTSMLFLKKFWGVIPWMLEAAIILDVVLGRFLEAAIIGGLLLFQALMGFNQERKAKNALALLRKRLSITARVKRDGQWQVIPADGLVPDDIIHLRVGDIVPADIKLSDGIVLIDQSQLTGESKPVEGSSGSLLYSGSIVNYGEATGTVVATGAKTYYGKTAQLIQLARAPQRLQILTTDIAKYLGFLDIILILILGLVSIFHSTPLFNLLPFSLMLLVVSVPVMLPPMFTMSSAIGASKLAEKGILTTRLSAIEDAATMDVLCLDKTGTITENRLSVEKAVSLSAQSSDLILQLAALASDEATQDPIDMAIIEAVNKLKLSNASLVRTSFKPFEPTTKKSEATVTENGLEKKIIKGTPAVLAELTHTPWQNIAAKIDELSAGGSRVIAVASGTKSKLTLDGFIALTDPLRQDSPQLIGELSKQGIKIVLITGDGEMTARAVATKAGIQGAVAPAGTIQENLDPKTATQFAVFSNVFPQDKAFLVKALQKAGHVVGMIGDGVNDAPALAQADVGIATANATDVAKSAASIVLTNNGLVEILTAIKVSRNIYQRMQTWILGMVSRKASIPPFLAISLILFGAFALNPLLIVLFMLFGDIAAFVISTDNVLPSSRPDRWIIRSLAKAGSGIAILFFLMSCGVFWLGRYTFQLSPEATQTFVFIWMVFAGAQAVLYIVRSTERPFWSKPFPSRPLLLVSIFDIALAVLMANQGWLMSPISLLNIGLLLIVSIIFLILGDLIKTITFKNISSNIQPLS